jgi:tetratricopeptide (TPR) repeat protein
MRAYDMAISLPDARMDRGKIFFKKGIYDKALTDFVEAGKQLPNDALPVMWQGLAQDRLGQTDDAAVLLKTALKMEPTLADPNYHLGRMEMDHGRPTVGLDYFRKAAKLMTGKEEWAIDLYFQLGTVERTNGSKPGAIAAFKKYLELAPADAPSRPEADQQLRRMGVQPEGKLILENTLKK